MWAYSVVISKVTELFYVSLHIRKFIVKIVTKEGQRHSERK